eukprot:3140485-Prymnesium_polylepis.1
MILSWVFLASSCGCRCAAIFQGCCDVGMSLAPGHDTLGQWGGSDTCSLVRVGNDTWDELVSSPSSIAITPGLSGANRGERQASPAHVVYSDCVH